MRDMAELRPVQRPSSALDSTRSIRSPRLRPGSSPRISSLPSSTAKLQGDNIANYTCKEEEWILPRRRSRRAYEEERGPPTAWRTTTRSVSSPQWKSRCCKFNAGFQAGAKFVNPAVNVLTDYVGGNNPFSDTTTAKEIALTQFSKGADIIYHAAGGSGLGVFQAACGADTSSPSAYNSNQNILDPGPHRREHAQARGHRPRLKSSGSLC